MSIEIRFIVHSPSYCNSDHSDPPSTTNSIPVINCDSSEAKNSTALATSDGCPNLFNGMVDNAYSRLAVSPVNCAIIGVSMVPGCTELTRILYFA